MKGNTLQNGYINAAMAQKKEIAIAVNGLKLEGVIKAVDLYTILIECSNNRDVLVYKSAITAILPLAAGFSYSVKEDKKDERG